MLHVPPWLLIALTFVGAVFFVATLVLVPRVLVQLPRDYFARAPRPRSLPYLVAKNLLGVVLLFLGVAMLVLPGQGVLTILLALTLLDVRWKRPLLVRILRQHNVRAAVDTLRTRAGAAPLELPDPHDVPVRREVEPQEP